MTLQTLPRFVVVLGVMAIAAAFLVPLNYLAQWVNRNIDRAPPTITLIMTVMILGTAVVAVTGVIPRTALPSVIIGVFLVGAAWGWIRHRRSPYLGRWEATWRRAAKLVDEDPGAADQLVLDTIKEDERERERLRGLAPSDRVAARAFLQATKRELGRATMPPRLAARVEPDVVPDQRRLPLIFGRRRARLEADLAWIKAILSRGDGAA